MLTVIRELLLARLLIGMRVLTDGNESEDSGAEKEYESENTEQYDLFDVPADSVWPSL
jgi:hypothetical protein